MATVLTLCAVVFTLAFLTIAIFLSKALLQLRKTAREAEGFLRRANPVLGELELAVHELRSVGETLSTTASRVDRVAREFEGVGTQAARAGRSVLSNIAQPLGRALALATAVKTGAGVLMRAFGHNNHRGTHVPTERVVTRPRYESE
jgi:hypothetical protein